MAKLLPQLNQIEWHDTGVHLLQVNFNQRQFRVVLDCYDEALENYRRKEVIFQEIGTLEWTGATGSDVEVSSLDISRVGEFYQAQLLLLTHHGPSSTVSFQFKEVSVELEAA